MHGYILKHIVQNPQQSVFNFRHNDKNSLKTPTLSGEKCNPAYEIKPTKSTNPAYNCSTGHLPTSSYYK